MINGPLRKNMNISFMEFQEFNMILIPNKYFIKQAMMNYIILNHH